MNKYLLDSSVIIDALNYRKHRDHLLVNLNTPTQTLGHCLINLLEIYAGIRETEMARTAEFFDGLEYYEVTPEIARQAGLFVRDYRRKGKALALTDATIAAVAVENELVLITDNVKDFPMSELKLYKLPKS